MMGIYEPLLSGVLWLQWGVFAVLLLIKMKYSQHFNSTQINYILGKYKTQLFDETTHDFMPASPGIGMHVEVTDPDKKILLSKYYASEGRFTFTSHTPGEHTICLHSNSTKWSLFAGGKLVSLFSHLFCF